MQLINRSNDMVGFRGFKPDDPLTNRSNVLFAFRAPLQSHWLKPGEARDVAWDRAKVQLEVTGPDKPMGSLTPTQRVYVYGSTSALFDESAPVVFTGQRLVTIDGTVRKVMELAGYVPDNRTKQRPKDAQTDAALKALLAVALGLLDGLVANFKDEASSLFFIKMAAPVAKALVSSMAPGSTSSPITIIGIQNALQEVIDDMKANENRSHILEVQSWFDEYTRHARHSLDQGLGDLDADDRAAFIEPARVHLLGQTAFLGALDEFKHNRQWRLLALPEYAMGVGLHLHMRRIMLMVAQETKPLDEDSIESLHDNVREYRTTLAESEADYVAACNDFFATYPLASPSLATAIDATVVFAGQAPLEGIQAADGLIAKYLKGDRKLLITAGADLDSVSATALGQLDVTTASTGS